MGPSPAVASVRLAVRRALADLEPGDLVLVAASGGADSLALAAAAAFEVPRLGLRAGAVTVDHGLQAGAGERARQVAEVLTGLGLDPVDVRAVQVGSGGGPEAAARSARYAALAAAADEHGAAAVLLAHTRDDQAETVLLGLARGSGGRSLAGMAARSGRYRRPLLGLDRATVRSAADGLPVWDDPHNDDPSFARVRVRRAALPALEDALGPGIAAALARTAALLRADTDALDEWAERAGTDVTGSDGSLDVEGLERLPVAVRSRVVRRAALAAGAPAGDLRAEHVEAVDALVTDWHGQGPLQLPGGLTVRRECGRLQIARA
jgi:tRNA(Ile)-lysidine synthase